jgi:anti-anti-sigma factor
MSNQMSITVSQQQGKVPVTVFHIEGEVNTNTYEALQTEAHKAFDAGARNLLLDLTKTTYISSAGLRAVHHIFTMLRSDAPGESDEAVSKGLRDGTFKSPHLKLLNPSASVFEVLKTMGFDMYLEIHTKLDQAVASFGA